MLLNLLQLLLPRLNRRANRRRSQTHHCRTREPRSNTDRRTRREGDNRSTGESCSGGGLDAWEGGTLRGGEGSSVFFLALLLDELLTLRPSELGSTTSGRYPKGGRGSVRGRRGSDRCAPSVPEFPGLAETHRGVTRPDRSRAVGDALGGTNRRGRSDNRRFGCRGGLRRVRGERGRSFRNGDSGC